MALTNPQYDAIMRMYNERQLRHQREQQDTQIYQWKCLKNHTQHHQRIGQGRADLGGRNDGSTESHGCILLGILDGMSHLMGGNPHRCNGGVVIHPIRQAHHIGSRVKMIRQFDSMRT